MGQFVPGMGQPGFAMGQPGPGMAAAPASRARPISVLRFGLQRV